MLASILNKNDILLLLYDTIGYLKNMIIKFSLKKNHF